MRRYCGITTLVISADRNASLPISVTFLPSMVSGMTTSAALPMYLSMLIVPFSRAEYSKSVSGFGVVLEITSAVLCGSDASEMSELSQPKRGAVSVSKSKNVAMIFFMMFFLSCRENVKTVSIKQRKQIKP